MPTIDPAAILAKGLQQTGNRETVLAMLDPWGIDRMLILRAYNGRPINAATHLLLCATVGVSPDGAAVPTWPAPDAYFDHRIMGMGLKMRRMLNRHDVRRAALACGLSTATITRIEAGEAVSIASVLQACAYIKVHPFNYFAPEKPRPVTVAVQRETSHAA